LEILDGLKISKAKFYLADAGYACCTGILPSFRSTRYYLDEFSTMFYPKMPRNFSISGTLALE
jgi:hypothetical protein